MYELAPPIPYTGKPPAMWNGGMAVNISRPQLAGAVNIAGEKLHINTMGVISGTALPVVMLNRIRLGDLAAMKEFIDFDKEFAEEIINEYIYKHPNKPAYPPKPEILVNGTEEEKAKFTKLAVAAAYVEVKLAKKNNLGPIGMNLLEKIQLMHLPTILGAMMAGVDYILVGAGIPDQIPNVLKAFAEGKTATYNMDVLGLDGKTTEKHALTLDPKPFIGEDAKLKKPLFFPIISHHLLAMMLADAADGFVVERYEAGGHNAKPRIKKYVTEESTPELKAQGVPDGYRRLILEYTNKDEPDIDKILKAANGKPVYLAGGASLKKARELGLQGIQVGSAFALTNEDESGMDPILAERVRQRIRETDDRDLSTLVQPTLVSPTGYPFQEFQLAGTWSDPEIQAKATRNCMLGYLVQAYRLPTEGEVVEEGEERIGFRCPAEPVNVYTRKGGRVEDTIGKGCLCRYLAATGKLIPGTPIITLGQKLGPTKELIRANPKGYSAKDVVEYHSQN